MYILDFQDVRIGDVPRVGGKNAGIGELRYALGDTGAQVPPGFAVTADGYRSFLEHRGLLQLMAAQLGDLDPSDVGDLQARGATVRQALLEAPVPEALAQEIRQAYDALGGPVAVRSSATAEDLPEASFAGQQETFLGVEGADAVVDAVRRCFASLFTDRAISYRSRTGFGHLDVALSVAVQRMVPAQTSGVMFTLDPDTGVRELIHIDAVRGLGEALVSGEAIPDQYTVFAPLLGQARPLLERFPRYDGSTFVLTEPQVLELAGVGACIERHFGRPMDIEWAFDPDGVLWVLQARPETVHAREGHLGAKVTVLGDHGRRIAAGVGVGQGVGAGPVRRLASTADLPDFELGDVLVARRTDPDWEPAMRKASAVVTEMGGRTSHAAIVCRELGVPAVVGVPQAMHLLEDGAVVTVSCAEGYEGHIYEGRATWEQVDIEVAEEVALPIRVNVNLADPFEAWRAARLPVDGVGLMRVEFVVNRAIGVHPMALVRPGEVTEEVRREIAERTAPYADGPSWFVERLASGIGQVAAAFWPRPVIVRLSDFKSNEYRALLGGEAFEPPEANPMLGWRGASRYIDPRFRGAFEMECRALERVRRVLGLTNVRIMVPFCRTLSEADSVLATLAECGLGRGEDGLEVYVMIEVPSNALLARGFAKRFDGFSIGSNDLTQLTLGIDRDAEQLAASFDESNEAVKLLIRSAIEGAHAEGIPVGICGQAPSDRPHFARWLMAEGIDSISLTPDSVIRTRHQLGTAGYSRGSVRGAPTSEG